MGHAGEDVRALLPFLDRLALYDMDLPFIAVPIKAVDGTTIGVLAAQPDRRADGRFVQPFSASDDTVSVGFQSLTENRDAAADLVRDALHSDGAKARGLFDKSEVDRLLADPNGYHTPLRGNPLWQLGLLELWLAHHVDGVGTA